MGWRIPPSDIEKWRAHTRHVSLTEGLLRHTLSPCFIEMSLLLIVRNEVSPLVPIVVVTIQYSYQYIGTIRYYSYRHVETPEGGTLGVGVSLVLVCLEVRCFVFWPQKNLTVPFRLFDSVCSFWTPLHYPFTVVPFLRHSVELCLSFSHDPFLISFVLSLK